MERKTEISMEGTNFCISLIVIKNDSLVASFFIRGEFQESLKKAIMPSDSWIDAEIFDSNEFSIHEKTEKEYGCNCEFVGKCNTYFKKFKEDKFFITYGTEAVFREMEKYLIEFDD